MAKSVTVQFDDGTAHVYNNVPDSISDSDVQARAQKEFGKQVVSQPSLAHSANVGLNAIYKGAGAGVDAFLNAPANLVNLGIAGVGTALAAAGRPDLAPETIETPDFARRGLEKTGLIRHDVTPQSAIERVVDAAGQGVGGGLITPAGSLSGMGRNAALGAISGGSGQTAREAAGGGVAGDIAGAVTSIAAPMAVSGAASYARDQISRLQAQKAANSAADAITRKGLERGYTIPASEVNPTAANKILESVGGKAATRQQAEINNQEVTNALVKEQLGIPANTPITEETLKNLRAKYSAPYREIASLPPVRDVQKVPVGHNPLTNQPITKTVVTVTDPAKVLEELKTARANANDWFKAYTRDAHPDTKAAAERFKQQASDLESKLEQIALNASKPKLVEQLRQARKDIAQTYSAEQALNVGSTNIDARAIGRMRDRGVPLTGNMRTIGEFAQQNPLYMRESSGVSTPGVSALDAMAAGMAVAGGKPLSGGVLLLRGPARALALSKWYQGRNAAPNYNPSNIAKLLKNFTPQEARLAVARAAMLESGQE